MSDRRTLLVGFGLLAILGVVLVVLVWAVGGDAAKGRQAACTDAQQLVGARLLNEARAAYRGIVKAHVDCPLKPARVAALEATAAKDREQGDQYLRAARLTRKAESGAKARKDKHEVRHFARAKLVDVQRAIAGYSRSFRNDPQDAATRKGLEEALQLLAVPGDRAANARCAAAGRLWRAHALEESAILYAQALRTGRTSRCVHYRLRAARESRGKARRQWRAGQALADAGRKQAARADYIKALTTDPSLTGARMSLDATHPPDPRAGRFLGRVHSVEHTVQAVAKDGDTASAWLNGHAGAFAVAAVAVAVIVVALMWVLFGLTWGARANRVDLGTRVPAFCRRRALVSPFTPTDAGDTSTTVFAHWVTVHDPQVDDKGDEAVYHSEHPVDAWDAPTAPPDDLATLFSGQPGVLAAVWSLLRRATPRSEARFIGHATERCEHGPGLRVLYGKRNGAIKKASFWWARDLPGPPMTDADHETEARHALAIWAAAWAREAARLP
jgi:tetratricopeptide (TPR) repeat protein